MCIARRGLRRYGRGAWGSEALPDGTWPSASPPAHGPEYSAPLPAVSEWPSTSLDQRRVSRDAVQGRSVAVA